ncbi:MAG: hypothetical protein K6E50_12425 [Lachnospiraceae bacterium]|nr:hypothetical protein [Lachnospiraceae bacterium]
MKKKNLIGSFGRGLGVLAGTVLLFCMGGCEKDAPGAERGSYEEPTQQAVLTPDPEPAVITQPEPTVADPEPEQTASSEIPVLVRSERSENYWGEDYRDLYLATDYQLLHVEEAYGESHPLLRDAVEAANESILIAESEIFSDLADEIKRQDPEDRKRDLEFGRFPEHLHWEVYTRRADPKILSYLILKRSYDGIAEYETQTCMAHNFYVESGQEIGFSEVVADEDAFYELLAEKTAKQSQEEMLSAYQIDRGYDPEATKQEILKCMKEDTGCWVLDPQGITFCFDSFIFVTGPEKVTVLFSEDTEGTIFTDAFRTDIPEDWIMQLPQFWEHTFDADDDGVADKLEFYESSDYDASADRFAVSGVSIGFDGKYEKFPCTEGADAYDYRAYLVHRGGKSSLLVSHMEYDYGYLDSYNLVAGGARQADAVEASIAWLEEAAQIWGEEKISPSYVPADPDRIPILYLEHAENPAITEGMLGIGSDGSFTEKTP